MGNTIGTKIVLEGEKEYRNAIKGINAEQKELRSELKLASAEFSGQEDSVEALTKKHDILTNQYDSQRKKVDIYAKALDEARSKQEKASEKVDTLKAALENAEKEFEEMKKKTDISSEALKDQQNAIDDLKSKLSLAQDEYGKTRVSTNEWQTSMNNAKTTLVEMEDSLKENKSKLEAAERSTDNTAESIDDYSKIVDDATGKTSVFGDVLKAELATETIKKGFEELGKAIKEVTDKGMNFESSMSQVAATMGMNANDIQAGSQNYKILKEAAKECGESTRFSASQSAEALNYLALAGYEATKSAETLPKVLDLASAGNLDLAYSSDLVTDAMSALGLETGDLDNFVDQMAKTSQKSNTNVAQLGEATLVCAGAVSMAKQPLDTMNAELGVLANNGIKGAEGGTHLRNVIMSLVTPTDKGADALEKLGVSVTDTKGNVRDLDDTMTDLNKALDGMSDKDRTKVLNQIFNKTDIGAVNALLKGTNGEFKKLKDELNNCSGAAKDMANTMEDNLKGKLTTLDSMLEGLSITAYDKMEGVFKNAVDAATDSVGKLQDSMENGRLGDSMDDLGDALEDAADNAIDFAEDALPALIDGLSWVLKNGDLVAAGIGAVTTATVVHSTIAPAIGAVTTAWKAYKTANENATVAQFLLNGAMSANPAGLVVTAIAGLVGALAVYSQCAKDRKTETEKLNEEINKSNEYIREQVKAIDEGKDSRDTELALIQNKKDQLLELNEKEELSVQEKYKMKRIVDELNNSMPDLNLQLDEETGHLTQTNEELETYIDNMYESLKVGYAREDLETVAKQLYEAEKNLAEAQEEYNKHAYEYEEVMKGWEEATQNGEVAMRKFNEELGDHAINVLENHDKAMQDTQKTIDDSAKLVDELQEQYDKLAGKLEEQIGIEQDAKQATDELKGTLVDYKGVTYNVTSEVAANLEQLETAYTEAYEKASETIEGQVSLFEKLSSKSELTATQMRDNLKSQTETFSTYKDDLLTASKLVEEGLMEEGLLGSLKSLRMDGAGYLHELVQAAQTDTESFNAIMEEWSLMTDAKSTLIETLADINSGYSDSMEELLGIQEEKNQIVSDNTEQLLEDTQKNLEKALDKQLKTTNESLDDMTQAVMDECPDIKAASQELCSASIEGANDILQIDDNGKSITFVAIGYSIPEGIAQGITENQGRIKQALQGAIDDAIESIDLSGITSKINRELGGLF